MMRPSLFTQFGSEMLTSVDFLFSLKERSGLSWGAENKADGVCKTVASKDQLSGGDGVASVDVRLGESNALSRA